MTEVERFVRERVAATGRPCIMAPAGVAPSLRVSLIREAEYDCPDDIYLVLGPFNPPETWDAFQTWEGELDLGLTMVRRWIPTPPDGVEYVEKDDCAFHGDDVHVQRHVQCTALGISLLQLRLNEAGSGLVIDAV